MTDETIRVDSDGTSTALKVLLAELASDGEKVQKTQDVGKVNTTEKEIEGVSRDPTDAPSRVDSVDSPLLEGISRDVTEEPVNEGRSEGKVLRETLVFVHENDITELSSFRPRDEDDNQVFPLRASGQVDSMFVNASSDTFKVYLELDGDKIIDSVSWTKLQGASSELAHVGAYQKSDDEYVVSVSDYPFNEELDFSISPTENTTFNAVRAEVMVDEFNTGEIE